jgi:DNA polymerase III delta prime subunit
MNATSSSPPRRRLLRYSAFCRNEEEEEEEVAVRVVVRFDLPRRLPKKENILHSVVTSEFVVYLPHGRHRCSVYCNQYVRVTSSSSFRRSVIARVALLPTDLVRKSEDDSEVYIDPFLAIHLGCYEDAVERFLHGESDSTEKTLVHLQPISRSMSDTTAAGAVVAVTLRLLHQRHFPGDRRGQSSAAIRPPLPPVGTLLQNATLICVTDLSTPGMRVEYLYQVQISNAEGAEDSNAVWVTTADTHCTILRADPDRTTSWPLWWPPMISVPALPHPNAPELLRALWTMCQPQPASRRPPSPAHCIFHLIGSHYEHDSAHLMDTVAQQLGRTCITVSGLAAAAVLFADNDDDDEYTVTTGGWRDKLYGLQQALRQAMDQAPSVLLLNRLDQEFTSSETRPVDESRLWNLLVETLSSASAAEEDASSVVSHWPRTPPVLVLLLTQEALPVGPIRQNLWHPAISLALPDAAYLEYLWTNDVESESSCTHNIIPMDTVHELLQGRGAGEILELRRAWLRSSPPDSKTLASLCQARDDARRHVSGRIAPVHWSDVGGLEQVRREILDAIEWPLQYPVLFGSARRSGILLYGPPGTGKTLVAKAVATECGVPFVSVKGPELLGSYVGESEAQVRSTFAQARRWARQNQPPACILFFDELDSIAPRRGDHAGSGAVMDRVVATLFTELDRGKDDDGAFVFCMGATNRPDMLDPALLRPGRFDRLVYLGVSSTDYPNILVTHLRKLRLDGTPESMAEVLIPHLPPHLTGADLSTIATGALIRATERLCAEADDELDLLRSQHRARNEDSNEDVTLDEILSSWDESRLEPVVTLEDLLEAAQSVVPSVNATELENYEQIHQKYRQRSQALPVEPHLFPDQGSFRGL